MYASQSFALAAPVKDALQRRGTAASGFSPSGKYGWAACPDRLLVWQTQQGSYAEVLTFTTPGGCQLLAGATSWSLLRSPHAPSLFAGQGHNNAYRQKMLILHTSWRASMLHSQHL